MALASSNILEPLESFAASLTETYSSMLGGQPEDQLKGPAQELLRAPG